MSNMKNLILRTAIFIAVLTASLAAFAAPTIVISDGVTAVTNSVASGEVFATLIDQYWTVYNANGNNLGDPHNPALELDVTPNDVAGGAPDLTITFSDNGFGPTPGRYFSVVDAGAAARYHDRARFRLRRSGLRRLQAPQHPASGGSE